MNFKISVGNTKVRIYPFSSIFASLQHADMPVLSSVPSKRPNQSRTTTPNSRLNSERRRSHVVSVRESISLRNVLSGEPSRELVWAILSEVERVLDLWMRVLPPQKLLLDLPSMENTFLRE
jgi:hypothetical protein